MEQPCDREDASQRPQILGTGDPQTTTSAQQGAFRHVKSGGQGPDSAWFDRAPKKQTENGRGTHGSPCVGAGEQSIEPFGVDLLEDGELQGTDVTDVTLLHARHGNRRFVRNRPHLGVGTRILDHRRGVLRVARPLVLARGTRGAGPVEIGVYDRW